MGGGGDAVRQWRKISVFISSTFGDMHAERDLLVKRVFPELVGWCEQRRLRLVDVDLRWGVTEQDATENKNLLRVCFDRIDECRPFFVCMLGQRRGSVPDETDVSSETFSAFPELRSVVGTKSVTELEIAHALTPFRDERKAASDTGKPAQYSLFYLRDGSYVSQLPDDPPALREVYMNEVASDALDKLRREIVIERWGRTQRVYTATWRTDLSTPALALPPRCPSTNRAGKARWRQRWESAGIAVDGTGHAVDPVARARAEEYNDRLCRGRLSGLSCDGRALEQVVVEDLQAAILDHYPEYTTPVTAPAAGTDGWRLSQELDQQEQFLHLCDEGFVDRVGDRQDLEEYLCQSERRLFALSGAAGTGKSTLLAHLITETRSRPDAPDLYYRFIGASDASDTVDSILGSLSEEMVARGALTAERLPSDPAELRREWPRLLRELGAARPTAIILDGLNQLATGLRDLTWLPGDPPVGTKLIVSFQRDSADGEDLHHAWQTSPHVTLRETRPFDLPDDRRRLVSAYLATYLKDLDSALIDALIDLPESTNPLYLKVVLTEMRVFGSFEHLGDQIREVFGETLQSAFTALLNRLERDLPDSPLPPHITVPIVFGALAHSRRGLSAAELIELLTPDGDEGRADASDSVQVLLRQVRPFLARRSGRYDFFYASFRETALSRYTKRNGAARDGEHTAAEWHRRLADHFSGLDPENARRLEELPYHLYQMALAGGDVDRLYHLVDNQDTRQLQFAHYAQPEPVMETIRFAFEVAVKRMDLERVTSYAILRFHVMQGLFRGFMPVLQDRAIREPAAARQLLQTLKG